MLQIKELAADCYLTAIESGLIIETTEAISDAFKFSQEMLKSATDFGRALNRCLPILVEQGIATSHDGKLLIEAQHVHHLYDESEYKFDRWLPPRSPYKVQLEANGALGNSNFTYALNLLESDTLIAWRRVGTFIQKGTTSIFFLPPELFEMACLIDEFNVAAPESKSKQPALICFAKIKELGIKCGAQFDSYLESETTIVPHQVNLGVVEDGNEITMSPQFDGVDDALLKKTFDRLSETQRVYDVQSSASERVRVVIAPEVQEAVKQIKKFNKLNKADKVRVLAEPRTLFTGITNPDCVDISKFGPRVKGVGQRIFQGQPFVRIMRGGFLDGAPEDISKEIANGNVELGITAEDLEGNNVEIKIADAAALTEITEKVERAIENDEPTIELSDANGESRTVAASDKLHRGLAALTATVEPKNIETQTITTKRRDEDLKFVLIYDNEEGLDYSEFSDSQTQFSALPFQRPAALKTELNGETFDLMDYQKEGVSWLQSCLMSAKRPLSNRRGVLLADDMGLGKTLQVLTFLSWCIETGLPDELSSEQGPYKPILVVAPVILLNVWQEEIEKFFAKQGSIFMPFLVMHGKTIKDFKVQKTSGKEYELGIASLDTERMCKYRLIITNYDTVKNYQHSFASIPLSVLVVDEAQEIKDPRTTVTWALKSLNSIFRVALTGTPVENRLLDLWNITDFFQPGLLGDARGFSEQYEHSVLQISDTDRAARANQLRSSFRHGTSDTYLLRRLKEQSLKGLPTKEEIVVNSALSQEQIDLHHSILGELGQIKDKRKGMHLTAIQKLSKLYQHIALAGDADIDKPASHYLESSPKLRETVKIIETIRARGEKVLIFALFLRMQMILKTVLDEKFDLDTDIINGTVAGTTSTGESIRNLRIKKFEERSGFNALILSPDVAGVGLTIVGANNVIHYGRWWNPAKESQATDRVYRLGQKRDVKVYYPLSINPEFPTFDDKLHALLAAKKQLARDFLVPTGDLNINESELVSELTIA